MDFSVIFQLRTKRYWWMDVIFYFVIAVLIATLLSYVVFLAKNTLQREDIQKETAALQTVGTDQQKSEEKNVISYRQKLLDFASLLQNQGLASNAFAFMQAQTMPNVWFKQFVLDRKNNAVQLFGESDDMDAFSRQVATFEGNKYVKNITTLNSSLGQSARAEFNINLSLDQNIFGYLSGTTLTLPAATTPEQTTTQPSQTTTNPTTTTPPTTTPPTNTQPKSSEKLITSFNILLTPVIVGLINPANFNITVNVPYGTDVKNLIPIIGLSAGASVSPLSNVSQDFTNPVVYRVTAEDGSIQDYAVIVVVAPPAEVAKKPSQSNPIVPIIIVIVASLIVVAIIILFVLRRMRSQKPKL